MTRAWSPNCSPTSSPAPPRSSRLRAAAHGVRRRRLWRRCLLAALDDAGAVSRCKVEPSHALPGHFSKDDFSVDLVARTVTCPAGRVARLGSNGQESIAHFGPACGGCDLASRCTSARDGRTIGVGPYEALLVAGRAATRDPAWRDDYRATRPKVERKIAHLMRRRHGGRRARMRGRLKVGADFSLLAAAMNLARLAILGLSRQVGPGSPGPPEADGTSPHHPVQPGSDRPDPPNPARLIPALTPRLAVGARALSSAG